MDERVDALQVPGEDGAVITPGPQRVPIRAEGERVHTARVTLVDGAPLAAGHVPDHHQAVIGPGGQRGPVGAEGKADEPLPMPGQGRALRCPLVRSNRPMMTPWFTSVAAASVVSVGTDGDRGVGAIDLADLAPEAMSTIAVPSPPATRIRFESGRKTTSRWKIGARTGTGRSVRRPWPRPRRARSGRTTPAPVRSLSVTAAMYLPSGLNERRVGGASSSPDNGAPTTCERRHVDERAARTCDRSTRSRCSTTSPRAAVGADRARDARPAPAMEATRLRVATSYLLRRRTLPDPAGEKSLAVRREPEVRKASVLLRMTAVASGCAGWWREGSPRVSSESSRCRPSTARSSAWS